MLSRHGSRYPTTGANVDQFGQKVASAAGKFKASNALAFLNSWRYELGSEILVPKGEPSWPCRSSVLKLFTHPFLGREELFQSGKSNCLPKSNPPNADILPGILHSYMYSQLYNPNSKIIVRTTVCSNGFAVRDGNG
jgi:hypothetical protein